MWGFLRQVARGFTQRSLVKRWGGRDVGGALARTDFALYAIAYVVDGAAKVALQVIGSSLAVKNGEGSVAMALNAIDISCRPSQLPDFIEVDISELQLNDKIFVKDLTTPVGEIVTDEEALVLNIKPAAILVEEEEDEEGGEGADGEEGATAEGAAEEKKDD